MFSSICHPLSRVDGLQETISWDWLKFTKQRWFELLLSGLLLLWYQIDIYTKTSEQQTFVIFLTSVQNLHLKLCSVLVCCDLSLVYMLLLVWVTFVIRDDIHLLTKACTVYLFLHISIYVPVPFWMIAYLIWRLDFEKHRYSIWMWYIWWGIDQSKR